MPRLPLVSSTLRFMRGPHHSCCSYKEGGLLSQRHASSGGSVLLSIERVLWWCHVLAWCSRSHAWSCKMDPNTVA
eukprot:14069216-Alexandrium_andersonii.AAC.1